MIKKKTNLNYEIKRIKLKGKYVIQLREKNPISGKLKITERISWTSKGPRTFKGAANINTAKTRYKQQGSIRENTQRRTGPIDTKYPWNFTEETITSPSNYKKLKEKPPKNIHRRKTQKYQYVIEGVILKKSGAYLEVVGASQKHEPNYPISTAREEAIENFYFRASGIYYGTKNGGYVKYDSSEGARLVEDGKVQVLKEGVKYYLKK